MEGRCNSTVEMGPAGKLRASRRRGVSLWQNHGCHDRKDRILSGGTPSGPAAGVPSVRPESYVGEPLPAKTTDFPTSDFHNTCLRSYLPACASIRLSQERWLLRLAIHPLNNAELHCNWLRSALELKVRCRAIRHHYGTEVALF